MKKTAIALAALALFAGTTAAQASITTYNVTETFNQVVYDSSCPSCDTIFKGSFSFDSATQTVSNLTGTMTQAMEMYMGVLTPGYVSPTSPVSLGYQLSSVSTLGGLLITSFHQNTTDTFSNSGGVTGTTGWATGGTQTASNQNAYVTIFVPLADLTAALTSAQTNMLAYGDCTDGSLMGMGASKTTCMTGYLTSTGAKGGTMMGVNSITQSIVAAPVPEADSLALILAGLGMTGFLARNRRAS